MINIAIVGYGRSAKTYHLPFIKVIADYNIKAFVSSNPKNVLKDYPEAVVYSSVEELAQDKSIDLTVITSPIFVHFEQAKALLEAGKNLVVEKPFTATSSEARTLVELAKTKNLKLCVFQNRRWDSSFIKLQELMKEGLLGDINFYEVHFDRYRADILDRWREEGHAGTGLVYELASHFVDQVVYLFGKPDSMSVDLEKQRTGSKIVDYYHIIFNYGKARVVLHASCLARAKTSHLIVHGSKASFVQHDFDKQEELLVKGIAPESKEWKEKNFNKSFLTITNENNREEEKELSASGSYLYFYQAMAKSILENKDTPVDPDDIILVTELLEQISLKGALV